MKNMIVIGAGTMGAGITQTFASKGFQVQIVDVNEKVLGGALSRISSSLDRFIKKGTLTEKDKETILSNIKSSSQLDSLDLKVDLIIEAIYESYDVKSSIFKHLNNIIDESTLIATNTSSISVTKLASNIKNPSRFIGMHFMNPVPLMPLIEIISGIQTSDETVKKIIDLTIQLDKTPIVAKDYPGFISNRVLIPMLNEAIFCLYEGVANKEEIDNIMKLGMNHPMGPLTLADFIGLDVCLSIMNVLYEGFQDSKYRACPLLIKMVEAGKLGKKSGEGFYKYI